LKLNKELDTLLIVDRHASFSRVNYFPNTSDGQQIDE